MKELMKNFKNLDADTVEDMLARDVPMHTIEEYDEYMGLDYDGTFEMYLIGETYDSMFV